MSERNITLKHLGVIWITVVLGMMLALLLAGRGELVCTPFAPFVLTLGCVAMAGLSALCIWGLLFLIPMGLIFQAWMAGRERAWRLLPAAMLLMSLLSSVGVTIMGMSLPMTDEPATGLSGFFEPPKEPTPEAMEQAYTLSVAACKECGRLCAIFGAALLVHLTAVCGWPRTIRGIRAGWQALRERSRAWHEESRKAQEAPVAAAGPGPDGKTAS